eukprot:352366-Chlamydomonas_euryale.AAC.3
MHAHPLPERVEGPAAKSLPEPSHRPFSRPKSCLRPTSYLMSGLFWLRGPLAKDYAHPSTSNVLKRSCSADSLAASSGVMLSSHSLPSAAHATKPPRARC